MDDQQPDVSFWDQTQTSEEVVSVKPDLVLPSWWRTSGISWSRLPGVELEVFAEWDSDRIAYSTRSVQVQSTGDISPTVLHNLSRSRMLRVGADRIAHVRDEDGQLVEFKLVPAELDRLAALGPVPETLLAVARVYAYLRAVGVPPSKGVVNQFRIEQRTASRWIAKARAADLLD